MLYSGLQLAVRPRDIWQNIAIWRHLATHGLGRKTDYGFTVYKERDMSGGMEPRVFTKFGRVR